MFRHRGRARTLVHNLKLASLLSFVAGIVNVAGFFSVQRLTTNVTGHFAYFADEVVKQHFFTAGLYLLYIICFLLGAFFSNLLIELTSKVNQRYANAIPVLAELVLLTVVAVLPATIMQRYADSVVCTLLFTMGLQNALVTKISDSVVRTTHLTGLFTDLGIELSQLFFYRRPEQLSRLNASVKLRFAIISFFFLGGVIGGLGYTRYNNRILFLAIGCLFVGIIYSDVRYRYLLLKKKHIK
ncbi:YoaK family protein [Niabella soli]|uniref:Membrane protein n=1 Tax=Niabella soli DSM 19437 TaxID=929713 RepID=W0EY15_9BACT|nr:YoaK family protein [Niabella soli]AHF14099.1 membrane protein [Niabella soli DSM 19437]